MSAHLTRDLVAHLRTLAPVIARAGDRVYWLAAPQGETAAHVVLAQVSGTDDVAHDGTDGTGTARVQVDCYATTWADARTLRTAIKTALNGWHGTLGTAPNTTIIDAVFHGNDIDFFEESARRYRATADFEIHHQTD